MKITQIEKMVKEAEARLNELTQKKMVLDQQIQGLEEQRSQFLKDLASEETPDKEKAVNEVEKKLAKPLRKREGLVSLIQEAQRTIDETTQELAEARKEEAKSIQAFIEGKRLNELEHFVSEAPKMSEDLLESYKKVGLILGEITNRNFQLQGSGLVGADSYGKIIQNLSSTLYDFLRKGRFRTFLWPLLNITILALAELTPQESQSLPGSGPLKSVDLIHVRSDIQKGQWAAEFKKGKE